MIPRRELEELLEDCLTGILPRQEFRELVTEIECLEDEWEEMNVAHREMGYSISLKSAHYGESKQSLSEGKVHGFHLGADRKVRACNRITVGAGQKSDDWKNLGNFPQTILERDILCLAPARHRLSIRILFPKGCHVCFQAAGVQAVYLDIEWFQFTGQIAGHIGYTGLCRVIGNYSSFDPVVDVRCEVDNFALSLIFHDRRNGPAHQEYALQVDCETGIPIAFIQVFDQVNLGPENPDTVAQNIDRCKSLNGPFYKIFNLCLFGYVRCDGSRRAAAVSDGLNRFRKQFTASRCTDHIAPEPTEIEGNLFAESLACACHQRRPIVQCIYSFLARNSHQMLEKGSPDSGDPPPQIPYK